MVCNSQNLNNPADLSEQNSKWKAFETDSPNVRIPLDWVSMRGRTYPFHGRLKSGQVRSAKSGLLGFVVGDRFKMFCLCRRVKHIVHRRSARAFRLTSSAGTG